jgi:hypothetical protein
MQKGGCVYIMANKNHTVLQIGVTSVFCLEHVSTKNINMSKALLQDTIVKNWFGIITIVEYDTYPAHSISFMWLKPI